MPEFKFDTSMSIKENLQSAGADWMLHSDTMTFGKMSPQDVPGHRAIYLKRPGSKNKEFVDVYGQNRTFYQNEQVMNLFDKLAKHYNLKLSKFGVKNADIYGLIDLPVEKNINVKEVGDIITAQVVVYESRYQDNGMRFYVHYNRLVCTNGMVDNVKVPLALINHVGQIDTKKIDTVFSKALELVNLKRDVCNLLSDRLMTIDEASLLLIQNFGDPSKSFDKQPQTVKTCLDLFDGAGEGSELLTAYNTAFGLLNAVTQHFSRSNESQTSFLNLIASKQYSSINKFERQLVSLSR